MAKVKVEFLYSGLRVRSPAGEMDGGTTPVPGHNARCDGRVGGPALRERITREANRGYVNDRTYHRSGTLTQRAIEDASGTHICRVYSEADAKAIAETRGALAQVLALVGYVHSAFPGWAGRNVDDVRGREEKAGHALSERKATP